MSAQDLQASILKKKARLAEIDVILNRSPDPRLVPSPWGGTRLFTPSKGSRIRLQENRLHLRQALNEQETALLLEQYHAATEPSARAAIARELAERGTPLRTPSDPTAVSSPANTRVPIVGSASSKVPLISVKRRRTPRQRDLDPRKKKIAELKARFPTAMARDICTKLDAAVEASPTVASQMAPLPQWIKKTNQRAWVFNYNHPETKDLVRGYINKVRPLFR
jgi:hypothetical protein